MGHVELQILLMLLRGPCHGYEMMKEIARLSGGEMRPGPGTLYVALRRLVDSGHIREVAGPATARSRRQYRVTPDGRAALRSELDRLSRLLEQAEAAGWQGGMAR